MIWSQYDDDRLTDFLFETNLSVQEIARELGKTPEEVNKEIRNLGLSWVRKKKGKVSRGHAALLSIMSQLLPGEEIKTEAPIGERLRLDVYCPSYNIAAEYHGRQHFYYVPFFHGDLEGFHQSVARDIRKEELCKDLGIALISFRYNDLLTEDIVFERMLEGIQSAPLVKKEKISRYKGNPFYEERKKRNKQYRKEQYRKMKNARKG